MKQKSFFGRSFFFSWARWAHWAYFKFSLLLGDEKTLPALIEHEKVLFSDFLPSLPFILLHSAKQRLPWHSALRGGTFQAPFVEIHERRTAKAEQSKPIKVTPEPLLPPPRPFLMQ